MRFQPVPDHIFIDPLNTFLQVVEGSLRPIIRLVFQVMSAQFQCQVTLDFGLGEQRIWEDMVVFPFLNAVIGCCLVVRKINRPKIGRHRKNCARFNTSSFRPTRCYQRVDIRQRELCPV